MFQIKLRIAEGVNFPYFVLGKAQLRILPFSDPWVWTQAQADPYLLFAQEYGVEKANLEDAETLWYDWLSRVATNCPDNAKEGLKYCPAPLRSIAKSFLPEYLSHWLDIKVRLARLLEAAICAADLPPAIHRNEQLFGLSYPADGKEIFQFNHFPTIATQKPGPDFVFGLGCLSLPKGKLLATIEREAANTLLQQIITNDRIAPFLEKLEVITKNDHYIQGPYSLIEAVNIVVRAIDKRGADLSLDDIPPKPGETGYRQITESLFRHRHLWPQSGLIEYVSKSLEDLLQDYKL